MSSDKPSDHFNESFVGAFPPELLSSTKNDDLLDADMDLTENSKMLNEHRTEQETPFQNDTLLESKTYDVSAEMLSTGSLQMGYVPGMQRADIVSIDSKEGSAMLDGVVIETDYEGDKVMCQSCQPCFNCCFSCCKPCLYKQHPLPQSPSICQRARYAFMCPPHGFIGHFLTLAIAALFAWAVLWSVTGTEALPGGNLFALYMIVVLGYIAGKFVESVFRGPALLGMLVVGFCLRNLPKVNIAQDIDPSWSRNIVSIALVVILVRAGLGLDPKALRRLSLVVFRLAFSPCLAETLTVAVTSHFILGFPWPWGFMMGFVLGAVSPAVVVPSMLSLGVRGLGVRAGIPTLVIAAASVDDVLAISGFGVLLGIAFSSGNIWLTLIRGPIEALVGVVYGIILGLLFWILPNEKDPSKTVLQFTLVLSAGLFAVLGSTALEVPGAGALGCLTVSFVAGLKYRQKTEEADSSLETIEYALNILWSLFQPLLFGLIGAEVDLDNIQISRLGLSVAVLGIGLTVRSVISFLSVTCTSLNLKERIFIIGAWLPKATVQAAIGAIALNTARQQPTDSENYERNIALGTDVLTLAVLAIVITAPLGAILIAITGPLLLKRDPPS